MASPTVNVGTGSTIGFGTEFHADAGAAVYELTNIAINGITRGEVDKTHLDVPVSPADFGSRLWKPTTIVQCGQVVVDGHWNPDITAPIEGAAGALTITWNGGAIWLAASAMLTNFDFTVPHEEMMGFVATWQCSAGWTITAG